MICLFSIFLGFIFDIGLLSLSCTASPVLPNKPFFVVWNHPSQGCGTNYLPFGDYGIVDNTNDKFLGDKIVLFYTLGVWPAIRNDLSIVRNGGIPQRANLTLHLEKVRSDVDKWIPNKEFSGLGVIDMEMWRPIWETDYTSYIKYKTVSINYVKERFPALTRQQQVDKATQEWNEAAREFMEETLKYVTTLRPNAKWGYYGYPRPWNNAANTVRINDEQSYIWNITSGLYPSIYFDSRYTVPGRQGNIKSNIKESLRLRNKFLSRDTPILPYTLTQTGPYSLFNETELEDSIGLPAEMGASGVVIWGASADLHRPNACQVLKQHITNTVGPYVLKLTNFFGNCSQQLCHGNGRCVRKDFVDLHQRDLETASRATEDRLASFESFERRDSTKQELGLSDGEPLSVRDAPVGYDFDDYACSCYTGSTGSRCDEEE